MQNSRGWDPTVGILMYSCVATGALGNEKQCRPPTPAGAHNSKDKRFFCVIPPTCIPAIMGLTIIILIKVFIKHSKHTSEFTNNQTLWINYVTLFTSMILYQKFYYTEI